MKLTLKAKHATGKATAAAPVVTMPKKTPTEPEASNDESDEGEEEEHENDDDDDDDGSDADGDDDDDDDDVLPADDNFDEDNDDGDEEEGAVGFADAMSKVLNQNVEEEKAPILAKRVTSQMREISKDKSTTNASKLSAKEKRAREEKDMVIPSHLTMAQDKALRGIATKGVVAFFNAIAKHQHGQQQQDGSKQIKSLSKDSFLGLLKQQGKHKEAAQPEDGSEGEDKSNWSVVQDDYMMGAKLKDFDKDDDVANEDEEVWNAAHDQLDSDNEDGSNKKGKANGAKKGGNHNAKKKGGNNKAQKKQRTR
ncbi:hypothetical protein H257_13358 [Aphanomyces astaci]|uniref:RRP15-like protein n=1 Tax=Aphanomyces astaci TaxID=112090 RepID=W4FVE9_APHAT|nr:hypothetical protein H257_13358 [Aphanomyces astaci]ETV71490.1 hypothetical protein H257_13358 [Aphanomyces astaci]|eukprot:XP_009839155.1 hypothetical protein H257_13358 [Aphanomyces astaci]